ncbi:MULTISPECIES: aldose epimerase family protein [Kitasatospora]|uniref:Aldose 1-epimerase n=1 Tax=Kitasatospora setae (strain ATCC 33774 / DSM 43861 / JCM 3304 / KCC A-0304 / NBRC 14216 / KM-6054) TaxID=452652 RepID=E4NJM5_KITSK|nr:aldose epimerase family protein [Kitasatospora setae]BAJ33173.1 putative aldose 1-epimerase [Kitasatospora setae KM-6054]
MPPGAPARLRIAQSEIATLPDGRWITRWTFGAPGGVTAEVLSLGARLEALHAPDRSGHRTNVVLGGAHVADLLGDAAYFGATVGRYANRVAGGRLPLDGTVHHLATQDTGHTLHGGPDGYATRLWEGEAVREEHRVGVRLRLHSPDGDQGFPGALTAETTYLLDARGELTIEYRATTDAPTVVNLTNHAYFNLAGEGSGTVLDHLLRVDAAGYLPVDDDLIPLGPVEPVAGTPFDLRTARTLGDRFALRHPQLGPAGSGYDHTWVLDGTGLRTAAVLTDPASGRRLECRTTEPGLQVYTGNLFDGSVTGRSGRPYRAHAGLALETQHFPDSPNRPDYPSTALRPGEEYRSTTVYRFTVTR